MKLLARCALPAILLAGSALAVTTAGWAKADPSGIEFDGRLEPALERAEAEGKPVVIFFYTSWCPVCTRMKRETFRAPELARLADRFVWARVDIDRALSTARDYGVEATPTTFVLDASGGRRMRLLGLQTATELRDSLEWFLERLDEPAGESIDAPTRGNGSELTWLPRGYRSNAICFSNVGYGPLALHAQSPFQSLRLAMRPRAPSTLGKGQFQLRGTTTWVNLWNVDDPAPQGEEARFFLDAELLQLALSVEYGITDTVEIEVEVQDRSRFGGIMDGFIEGFHDLVGIEQNGRDLHPRDRLDVRLRPEGEAEVTLDGRDRGSYTRSVQATLQHNLTCGTRRFPALSYSFTSRYETLDVRLSEGSPWVFGASVAAAHRFGRSYLYATLGYGRFGRNVFRGIQLDDTQFSWMLAFERRLVTRVSLLVQYLWTQGVIRDFGPFSEPSNEITLGFKWEVRDRGTFEIGLIENIIEFDNSPDLGFHFGYTQRF